MKRKKKKGGLLPYRERENGIVSSREKGDQPERRATDFFKKEESLFPWRLKGGEEIRVRKKGKRNRRA